jgi:hypothetical protein
MIPVALKAASFVPVPAGEKIPRSKGWPELRLSAEEIQPLVAAGSNVALRVGRISGDLVDVDLDSPEALALADYYLPPTKAEHGRPPPRHRAHRLYIAPGAVFASYADPTNSGMLAELRADGRDGGAHLSLIPPSITSGERRKWFGEVVEPAEVKGAVLARRMAWLAIGCLTMRHLSEHAARRPAPDLPALLWEADHALGRAAYRWLGEPAPDEQRRQLKHRREMSREEIDLAELIASIPNNFDWHEWNRYGMAIFAASGGSEEGFAAFDDLSARSSKYNPHAARERWRNYRRSPPSRIGLGTLIYTGREHGWRRGAA